MYVVEITFEESEPVHKVYSNFEEAQSLYDSAKSESYRDRSSLKSGDFVKHSRILSVPCTTDVRKAAKVVKEDKSDLYKEIRSTIEENREISEALDELCKRM